MNAQPFLFGEDLGRPATARRAADQRTREADSEAETAAERAGYARGFAAGRAEEAALCDGRRIDALERIAAGLGPILSAMDARIDAIETEALAFFEALARAACDRALAAEPLAAIRHAAIETFRHLRGVPHVAARVHASLVDDVEAMLRSVARDGGYEGRVLVIGSEEVALGDARFDWADGGVVSDRRVLMRAVNDALASASGGAARGVPAAPGPAGPAPGSAGSIPSHEDPR